MAIKQKPGETVDSMLKRFKKETMKSEVLKDLRKHEFYVAPSEKRRKKSAEAQKRARKNASKMKQY